VTDRIDLTPTEEDFQYWMDTFVPSPGLWWWDDSAIPNEAVATRVIPRSEHRNDEISGNIVYVNAYLAWQMTAATTRIIVDDCGWLASLSAPDRRSVRERQVELNRGKCVPLDRFGNETGIPAEVIVANMVVLDQALWQSLPIQTKRSVVLHELADWDRSTSYIVPNTAPVHVAGIANRFVHQEGINCLAVTAFAISSESKHLEQWMMPEAFMAVLHAHGFARQPGTTPQSGDVMIFRNETGDIVHAVYALEEDRFLNKSGQTTFNPIAIMNFDMVLEDWSGFGVDMWRR